MQHAHILVAHWSRLVTRLRFSWSKVVFLLLAVFIGCLLGGPVVYFQCSRVELGGPGAPPGSYWQWQGKAANLSYFIEWSADGEHILLAWEPLLGHKEVFPLTGNYIVRSNGTHIEMLFDGEAIYNSPRIAPTGDRLVYATTRHLTQVGNSRSWLRNFEIETSRLDGSDQQRLTTNRFLDTSPTWSPDGNRIAFLRRVREDNTDATLHSISRDGSDEQVIAHFVEQSNSGVFIERHLEGPSWSPNGQAIAIVIQELKYEDPRSRLDGSYSQILYLVDVDGKQTKRVFEVGDNTTNPSETSILHFTWSPDGETLAFSIDNEEERAIFVVRSDGDSITEILDGHGGKELAWSPDGQEILSSDGFAIRPDGTGFRQVFPRSLAGRIANVAWSPNGSRIAVSTENGRLITSARDGTDLRVLVMTNSNGELVLADSPEGRASVDTSICIRESVVLEPNANPGLVQDCEALLKSRDNFAGTAELDWGEGKPIGRWEGVIVRGSPLRVKELLLKGKNFTGTIPPDLGQLTELETLWLSGMGGEKGLFGLTGRIPPELGHLNNLIELDLSANNLEGSIPPELGGLVELWALQLQNNNLSGSIPAEMAGLRNLTLLIIHDIDFSGCVPIELSDLWVRESGLERCEAKEQ